MSDKTKPNIADVFADIQYRAYNARWPDAVIKEIDAARAAVAELVEAANAVAEEHFGVLDGTKHDGDDDEVGARVCCGVISYKDHAPDCPAVRLRAALARVRGKGVQEVGDG